jgi:soluble lytic murein transglycosylase-like protein
MNSSIYKYVGMLLTMITLCALPAHGQIVSYMDSTGKRVFINAEPARAVRQAKASTTGASAAGLTASGTRPSAPLPPLISAAVLANREKIEVMIREVSARYRVDPALVRAVMETESNWNSAAVSPKGALGLMQLIPATAQQFGVSNAFDPGQNLDGGVHYLQMLLQRYNGDLDKSLAAYNAGPGAVDRAGGIPRYQETRNYVQKVTGSYYRPGSDRLSRAFNAPRPIYRAVGVDGRVVFTNE